MVDNKTPKIFISYSSTNEDFAELVGMKLTEANIFVWKDTDQIRPGKEWRNEIDYALLNVDIVLVLLDKNSVNSPYVTYEWAFALGNGKTIIPLITESCDIHPRISVLQYLDFKDKKRPWGKLIEMIKSIPIDRKETVKISDLTINELESILIRSKALASPKEDAETNNNVVTSMVNQLASAKKYFDTTAVVSNTILWVDDRPDNNLNERRAFESIGFSFDLALSTAEALVLFSRNAYVAIISDMGRVEGPQEGYVLLREIRKIDKDIPFFIYAGSTSLKHKLEAQERGAQGSTGLPNELINLVIAHVQPNKLE